MTIVDPDPVPEVTVKLSVDEIRDIADKLTAGGKFDHATAGRLVSAIPVCNDPVTLPGGAVVECSRKFHTSGLHCVITDEDIRVEWP